MKLKKRKKSSRIRGARTCGWGFRQKHKGTGNKGGHGWSGTGKRASQKEQVSLMKVKKLGFKKYFGKKGFTSISTTKKREKKINLQDIKSNLFDKPGQKIDLKNFKILGKGEGFKATISAETASKSAIEKMKGAGGEIILQKKDKPEKSSKDKDGKKKP